MNYESNNDTIDDNPFHFDEKFKVSVNKTKGGLYLTRYLTYNCLENSVEEQGSYCIQWECPVCGELMYTSVLQRLVHYRNCCETQEKEILMKAQREFDLQKQKENPSAKEYKCPHIDCEGMRYYFTAVQLLKHKNSHKKSR